MSSSNADSRYLSPLNEFLVSNDLRISDNPCVSPDFCLDWGSFVRSVGEGGVIKEYPKSAFATEHGDWTLVENEAGDHAWCLSSESPASDLLADGVEVGRGEGRRERGGGRAGREDLRGGGAGT